MRAKLLLCILIIFLGGCALPSFVPNATSLSAGVNEIVVIGKIELDPPVNANLEQQTHWNVVGDGRILNQLSMATGASPEPVSTSPIRMRDWQAGIDAKWGEIFVVKMPRQRTFFRGAMMQLDVMSQDRLWFPGGVYFDIPDGAQAIYIGTLRYYRDDFNVILRAEVIDEFNTTKSELKQRFANTELIQRSLLQFF